MCFFKQKTSYEMRISDWSSDVCSSDLINERGQELVRGRGSAITGEHIQCDIWISRHQRIADELRIEPPGTIELGPIPSAGVCQLPVPGSQISLCADR